MSQTTEIDELAAEIQASPKYRAIDPALVRRIAAQELAKGRNRKEALKAARGKLHQIGGAYQENPIGYTQASTALATLPHNVEDPGLRAFCRDLMKQHASTRERLPILETFFQQTLASLGPIRSVLDVACGLNPLALPWMPLAPGAEYWASDIYSDMTTFLNQFFVHLGQPGGAEICDLTTSVPTRQAQLGLLLKTLPCLEQVDKSIGPRLLQALPVEHLLVSFPARSLGGRSKGMPATYEARLRELLVGLPWRAQRFEFFGELAFLLSRV